MFNHIFYQKSQIRFLFDEKQESNFKIKILIRFIYHTSLFENERINYTGAKALFGDLS